MFSTDECECMTSSIYVHENTSIPKVCEAVLGNYFLMLIYSRFISGFFSRVGNCLVPKFKQEQIQITHHSVNGQANS